MPVWLETLLEILKISVPALIVFLTTYYLLKQYLDKQYQLRVLELRKGQQKTSVPLKLQAYERLSLFCERIALPNLLMRLRSEDATAASLRVAMLLAIQQEFEHNITQQVYISDQLWQIIKIARDETVTTINGLAEKADPKAPAAQLASIMLTYLNQRSDQDPLDTALSAIKKEAGLLLG